MLMSNTHKGHNLRVRFIVSKDDGSFTFNFIKCSCTSDKCKTAIQGTKAVNPKS
jgi:hypothetical protein